MEIFGYKELKNAPQGGVIALGFFDGVHAAHRKILKEASLQAQKRGLPFGIFTFSAESDIKSNTRRLYTTEERLGIIDGLGADFAVVAGFGEIRGFGARDFVGEVLIKGLDASVAVAGYNFRFGNGREGNGASLSALMKEYGRETLIIDEIRIAEREVSSTVIRGLIEDGRIKEANGLLGLPYFLSGEVVHGKAKGRNLGFPTVNTALSEKKIIPKPGVYRSLLQCEGKLYNAVTNIGTCPTLGEREMHSETHLIDFSGDLYGRVARIFLLDFLREEKLFANEKELIMQINIDKNTTIKKNGVEKWQELGLK